MTVKPEVMARLQRAVEHHGERPSRQPAAPAGQPTAQQSRMGGLGRLIERVAGHNEAAPQKPTASTIAERVSERVATRARQAETDFDDLASPDNADDNVEIPAFLRRQAN